MKTINGTMLRSVRQTQGLTIQAMSDASGVQWTTIYNMETGRSPVSSRSFFKYCEFLGLNPLEVLK